jgi:hypothetical protein
MKVKLMAVGAVLAALVSSAAAQQVPCSGILADPRVQALATQAVHQIPVQSLTNPEEVFDSFHRIMEEVTSDNMRNGSGDARSRVDLYVAVHAALLNSRSALTKPWIPPKSKIRPPGLPAREGYRPPEAWRQIDPSLHRLLIKACFPELEKIKARVAARLENERAAAAEQQKREAEAELHRKQVAQINATSRRCRTLPERWIGKHWENFLIRKPKNLWTNWGESWSSSVWNREGEATIHHA